MYCLLHHPSPTIHFEVSGSGRWVSNRIYKCATPSQAIDDSADPINQSINKQMDDIKFCSPTYLHSLFSKLLADDPLNLRAHKFGHHTIATDGLISIWFAASSDTLDCWNDLPMCTSNRQSHSNIPLTTIQWKKFSIVNPEKN